MMVFFRHGILFFVSLLLLLTLPSLSFSTTAPKPSAKYDITPVAPTTANEVLSYPEPVPSAKATPTPVPASAPPEPTSTINAPAKPKHTESRLKNSAVLQSGRGFYIPMGLETPLVRVKASMGSGNTYTATTLSPGGSFFSETYNNTDLGNFFPIPTYYVGETLSLTQDSASNVSSTKLRAAFYAGVGYVLNRRWRGELTFSTPYSVSASTFNSSATETFNTGVLDIIWLGNPTGTIEQTDTFTLEAGIDYNYRVNWKTDFITMMNLRPAPRKAMEKMVGVPYLGFGVQLASISVDASPNLRLTDNFSGSIIGANGHGDYEYSGTYTVYYAAASSAKKTLYQVSPLLVAGGTFNFPKSWSQRLFLDVSYKLLLNLNTTLNLDSGTSFTAGNEEFANIKYELLCPNNKCVTGIPPYDPSDISIADPTDAPVIEASSGIIVFQTQRIQSSLNITLRYVF